MKVKLIFLSILIGILSILVVGVVTGTCITKTPYTASINDYFQQDCSILGNYYCKDTIIIEGSCSNPTISANHKCKVESYDTTSYHRYCNADTEYKCMSDEFEDHYLNGELTGDSCE